MALHHVQFIAIGRIILELRDSSKQRVVLLHGGAIVLKCRLQRWPGHC